MLEEVKALEAKVQDVAVKQEISSSSDAIVLYSESPDHQAQDVEPTAGRDALLDGQPLEMKNEFLETLNLLIDPADFNRARSAAYAAIRPISVDMGSELNLRSEVDVQLSRKRRKVSKE